jgi:hypothetical protein
MSVDRQAIVASFAGGHAFSPRIQRTTHLLAALEREFGFRVERVPGQPGDVGPFTATLPRRLARRVLRPLVLDDFEVPARLALRGWKPSARGALLIGWPFSPIYVAASRLLEAEIPYVVDAGDPWALTEPAAPVWSRRLPRRRAKSAEAFLWSHAAAGVVTTARQARSLNALFPDLDLLVRPNGYEPAHASFGRERADDSVTDELRLVQFGSVNPFKLPIGGWLSMLRRDAGLRRVRFANYGSVDRPDLLETEDPAVVIEVHEPVEWARACEIARGFDGAVVVANTNPDELPSKAIQYLTLPIPRVAVTAKDDSGELGAFAAHRPGYVGAAVDSHEDASRLVNQLRRPWSDDELRAPPGDSWSEVGRQVVRFAIEAWGRRAGGRGNPDPVAAPAAAG